MITKQELINDGLSNDNWILEFNGVRNPSFMQITSIQDRLLPFMEISTLNIPNRIGQHRFNKNIGMREIVVTFHIEAPNEEIMRARARVLANHFLHTTEPARFVNREEPSLFYMAEVSSGGELRETVFEFGIGRCLVTFLCVDPHAYRHESRSLNLFAQNGVVEVQNDGTQTHPFIKVELQETVNEFAIVTANDHLAFGEPPETGNEQVATSPIVLDDPLNSLAGWASAPTVINGAVTGQLTATSFDGFVQENNQFNQTGSPTGWRGGTLRRAIDRPLQDFSVSTRFRLSQNSDDPLEQLGRIHIYLQTVTGENIANVQIEQRSRFHMSPRIEFNGRTSRIGTLIGDDRIQDFERFHAGIRGILHGRVRISRIGRRFTCNFSAMNAAGNTVFSRNWNFNITQAAELLDLTHVQVHIGARDAWEPLRHMQIRHLEVRDEAHIAAPESNQIIPVFHQGDVLEINSETGEIYRNGESDVFARLNPLSTFPRLQNGMNQIAFHPPTAVEMVHIDTKTQYL